MRRDRELKICNVRVHRCELRDLGFFQCQIVRCKKCETKKTLSRCRGVLLSAFRPFHIESACLIACLHALRRHVTSALNTETPSTRMLAMLMTLLLLFSFSCVTKCLALCGCASSTTEWLQLKLISRRIDPVTMTRDVPQVQSDKEHNDRHARRRARTNFRDLRDSCCDRAPCCAVKGDAGTSLVLRPPRCCAAAGEGSSGGEREAARMCQSDGIATACTASRACTHFIHDAVN